MYSLFSVIELHLLEITDGRIIKGHLTELVEGHLTETVTVEGHLTETKGCQTEIVTFEVHWTEMKGRQTETVAIEGHRTETVKGHLIDSIDHLTGIKDHQIESDTVEGHQTLKGHLTGFNTVESHQIETTITVEDHRAENAFDHMTDHMTKMMSYNQREDTEIISNPVIAKTGQEEVFPHKTKKDGRSLLPQRKKRWWKLIETHHHL